MSADAQIGVVGLGVMGRNLALNMTDHGYRVAVHDTFGAVLDGFAASGAADGRPISIARDLPGLIADVAPPRPILLMIKAGPPVDDMLDALMPHLAAGDMVIDGGNSHFRDTVRRTATMAERGLHFVGVGVSGGEEGARHGPSLMAGGNAEAYGRIGPIFEAIAAQVGGQPCAAHVGPDGAGHFVKTLHNGIEYADMQLIAEVYYLLAKLAGLDASAMADVFAEWNRGELNSYLIEITADILRRVDPETGRPMVDVILDRAGQKGTGQWASAEALALGVPAPTVAEAVFARTLSALKDERVAAEGHLPAATAPFDGDANALVADLRRSLFAAKLCAYAQGFAVLRAAGEENGWPLDFATIARIWRGGCIIRAQFLDRIASAYDAAPTLANLLLGPYFTAAMAECLPSLRRVAAAAASQGLPVPGLQSALSYYDGYRTGRLWANMIQAQRDYFGAHTFERVDRPGSFHFDWVQQA